MAMGISDVFDKANVYFIFIFVIRSCMLYSSRIVLHMFYIISSHIFVVYSCMLCICIFLYVIYLSYILIYCIFVVYSCVLYICRIFLYVIYLSYILVHCILMYISDILHQERKAHFQEPAAKCRFRGTVRGAAQTSTFHPLGLTVGAAGPVTPPLASG